MSHFNKGPQDMCILLFFGVLSRGEFHLPGWLSMDLEEREGAEPVAGLLNISSNSTSIRLCISSVLDSRNDIKDNLPTNALFSAVYLQATIISITVVTRVELLVCLCQKL